MQPAQGSHVNVEPPTPSGGPRWRPSLYQVVLALIVAGGFISAYLLPNGPLLTWWLVAALGLGAYLSFAEGEAVGLASRTRRLVHLHCVLIPAALVTTQLAARRLTSATHLKFTGVLFEDRKSTRLNSSHLVISY